MNHYYHSEDMEMNDSVGLPFLTLSETAVILDVIYDKAGMPEALVVMDEGYIDLIPLGDLPIVTLFDEGEDTM